MFGFFKKKAEVLEHWFGTVDAFSMPSSEFYDSAKARIGELKIPGLQMDTVDFREGGVVSDKRTYLRMLRGRLVFDVCAAPFGTRFFFSCRMAYIPPVIQWWEILIFGGGFMLVFFLMFQFVGVIYGPLLFLFLLIMGFYILRNAVAMGLSDLDASLIRTPIIGPLYEAYIRRETYYRRDTELMYVDTISNIVKELVEEATASKGVKLVRQYELPALLGDVYRPASPKAPVPKAA